MLMLLEFSKDYLYSSGSLTIAAIFISCFRVISYFLHFISLLFIMSSAKWREEDMESALPEVRSGVLSIRAPGLRCSIPESSIHLRKKFLY